ncbi:MAG TPA: lmo0937 family membrane protein [Bacteroidales bacterium]|nr:lmo0937 family membrane protein [Bacteroidales bacterium]
MKTLLFIVAAMLLLGWILGLTFKIIGLFIHVLLVLAVIAIVVAFIKKRRKD